MTMDSFNEQRAETPDDYRYSPPRLNSRENPSRNSMRKRDFMSLDPSAERVIITRSPFLSYNLNFGSSKSKAEIKTIKKVNVKRRLNWAKHVHTCSNQSNRERIYLNNDEL